MAPDLVREGSKYSAELEAGSLCANVDETPTPPEITVEGELGIHDDEFEDGDRRRGLGALDRIVAMLIRLIQRLEQEPR